MLDVTLHHDTISFGRFFGVSFQRTLRIPDDGNTYPLPPGLGKFPVRRIADYAARVPKEWRGHGGVFLPMYQREALWISLAGRHWHPTAVQVGVGGVNAVSGQVWDGTLRSAGDGGQNYLVAPPQAWLDGINAGEGLIRQFVAMPLGMGYTVEAQLTGAETTGGLQIQCFDAKPGRFPDEAPPELRHLSKSRDGIAGMAMGLAAGGRMRQRISADPHGVDTWDPENTGRIFVHLVTSQMWREITGEPTPPTPVDVHAYTKRGLPWFELYDEEGGDVSAPESLATVKSVAGKDAEHGFTGQQDDTPLDVPPVSVVDLGAPKDAVKDGAW